MREIDVVGDVCVRALERADVDAAVLEVDGDDTTLEGDPALLARAVGNLIENAVRHAGGVAEVRVSGDSEYVRVAVSDRGPGFADGDVDRVFEQFHRGEHNARATLEGFTTFQPQPPNTSSPITAPKLTPRIRGSLPFIFRSSPFP